MAFVKTSRLAFRRLMKTLLCKASFGDDHASCNCRCATLLSVQCLCRIACDTVTVICALDLYQVRRSPSASPLSSALVH